MINRNEAIVQARSTGMYVNYFLGYPGVYKTEVDNTWVIAGYCAPNECRMMIPGTYAEMHKDYD